MRTSGCELLKLRRAAQMLQEVGSQRLAVRVATRLRAEAVRVWRSCTGWPGAPRTAASRLSGVTRVGSTHCCLRTRWRKPLQLQAASASHGASFTERRAIVLAFAVGCCSPGCAGGQAEHLGKAWGIYSAEMDRERGREHRQREIEGENLR